MVRKVDIAKVNNHNIAKVHKIDILHRNLDLVHSKTVKEDRNTAGFKADNSSSEAGIIMDNLLRSQSPTIVVRVEF